jgi:hypothetical protein
MNILRHLDYEAVTQVMLQRVAEPLGFMIRALAGFVARYETYFLVVTLTDEYLHNEANTNSGSISKPSKIIP